MKKQDLTGKKFGNFTVLEEGTGKAVKKVYWKCRCELCGNITNIEASKLKSGNTKSCGCIKGKARIKNLIGKQFGHLTVISLNSLKDNKTYWNCLCTCNKTVIKQGKLLTNGHVTSCGCQKGKSKIKDITNKRFGALTALSRTEDGLWNCICDCGKQVQVKIGSLTTGNTRSCGCRRNRAAKNRQDLTGKTFGKLSVIRYLRTENKKTIWLCKCDCGKEIEVKGLYLIHSDTKSCGCMKVMSFAEKEVLDYVKSIYKGTVIENDRNTIAPKELDIFVPEKNFAIEYDGLYWHSEEAGKKQTYHLNKTKRCNEQNIRLMHIYENEWRDKKDIVKSMIASALGVYERKIYARKCELREVCNREEVAEMFNENHLQGTVSRYSKVLGLYYKGELVQACMFGKQHFGKTGEMELYRMVTLKNTQVLGGFSKIMKNCGYDKVVSYVSLRTFNASGYYSSGWSLEHISSPSFCITDGLNTYSRQLFKKDKCLKKFNNVTENMTEREMCMRNGFYRLWDCGTYKVVYNNLTRD